jgi:hypothetical protein
MYYVHHRQQISKKNNILPKLKKDGYKIMVLKRWYKIIKLGKMHALILNIWA